MLVMGTRPEAIKMAPVYYALRQHNPANRISVCATAQHRQMLDQVLALFAITPDIDLNLMKAGQGLTELSAAVLTGMKAALEQEKPDLILVHGDTTTTLMASLAAFYAGIPVGHVEAGLRTHDLAAPYPEEMNRQVVGRLARWHFAPTNAARQNLLEEGVDAARVTVTGNTVIDALQWVLGKLERDGDLRLSVHGALDACLGFAWRQEPFVLVTGHRRENFGQGMKEICNAIATLTRKYPDLHFVYPVHLNPNVIGPVRAALGDTRRVHLISPQDYLPFVALLQQCHIVLTDSGGLQEEAPGLGKPVLVMRDVTERPEAVAAGTVKLVGADAARIIAAISSLLDDRGLHERMAKAHNPYGDGTAAARIAAFIAEVI
ncbi:MAG TPA: UDP-N-acetylglucosamine 2-epimerase (non-hydrolyzing) [Aestuariivirga sp.]|nr:UDP-N-acetylglucosamine 2-epimerase (non-hydrolyzing) [Aestuariivirga sp.]